MFLSINASFHRSCQDTSLLNDEYRQISCVQKASLQHFILSLSPGLLSYVNVDATRSWCWLLSTRLSSTTFDRVITLIIRNRLITVMEIIQNHQFKESLPHLTRPLPPFLPTLSSSNQKGITRRPIGGLRGAIG